MPTTAKKTKRRYPIGAEIQKAGVHFRVWASDHKEVSLCIEKEGQKAVYFPMQKEKDGYFSLLVPDASEGTLYRYKVSKSRQLLADPASRFQPQGPTGPSKVIDPAFRWTDQKWSGVKIENQIIYEMHIGTFTQEGTFKAATSKLDELVDLGVTLLEILPINEFPGGFGWGYDGVNLYAPTRLYGTPYDVKAFINRAHQLGLGVVLDVVYNHLGPEGNQLTNFSKGYFNKKFATDWGDAINFDLPQSREFFVMNARYWIEEFHFDGLRVDATPWFFGSTKVPILTEIVQTARQAGGKKNVIMIAENEQQDTDLLRRVGEGGNGFDAMWNDDFHHSAVVRLRGKREAYYTDYLGSTQEFISSLKYGFLYQGQYYDWQKKTRGKPHLDLPASACIIYLENHDQVANTALGKRLHQVSDPGYLKALTCLLLLAPNTPLLFQGQEFGSSKPFLYFSDHADDLNVLISKGRKEFLRQFPRLATSEARRLLPSPSDPLTFTRCKLDFREKSENEFLYLLHKDLIKMRKEDDVFKNMSHLKIDGAVLGGDSFLIRYFGGKSGDRLLIVNFGPDHFFNPAPEPLLVAGKNLDWEILWSSESFTYNGEGTPPINVPHWKILGHSAIVLKTVTASSQENDAKKH